MARDIGTASHAIPGASNDTANTLLRESKSGDLSHTLSHQEGCEISFGSVLRSTGSPKTRY